MEKIDYKKAEKHLYMPKAPAIIEVPEMAFFAVDGQGDPNTAPAYAQAMEILYGLSFTVKMSKMGGEEPAGYYEYVVPPLEGLTMPSLPASANSTPLSQPRALKPTLPKHGATTKST